MVLSDSDQELKATAWDTSQRCLSVSVVPGKMFDVFLLLDGMA